MPIEVVIMFLGLAMGLVAGIGGTLVYHGDKIWPKDTERVREGSK